MPKIILASKSPRRLDILRKHGIEPEVMPTETEEILPENISMTDAVEYLAEEKAKACYFSRKSWPEECIIIAADTIVYKNEILGKPKDANDAFRMLKLIRNDSHDVCTGVAIINTRTGDCIIESDITKVFCKDYSDKEIRDYINQEQPYDKAGAYAIQGSFREHIDHIEGDYENVVGLPFHIIEKVLSRFTE